MGRGLEISPSGLTGEDFSRLEESVDIGALAVDDTIVLEYYGNVKQKVRLDLDVRQTGTRGDRPSYIGISRQDGELLQIHHVTHDNPLEGGERALTEPIPNLPIEWDPDANLWIAGSLELIRREDAMWMFLKKVAECALEKQYANRARTKRQTADTSGNCLEASAQDEPIGALVAEPM
jgi:hypothetical protein